MLKKWGDVCRLLPRLNRDQAVVCTTLSAVPFGFKQTCRIGGASELPQVLVPEDLALLGGNAAPDSGPRPGRQAPFQWVGLGDLQRGRDPAVSSG